MLSLEIIKEHPHHILTLNGEIDASNSVELDDSIRKMIDDGAQSILVDGTNLHYISSAGLGVFMSYLEDFQAEGIRFIIYGLGPSVLEVFKILGLDQLISIMPDKETVIKEI
ncbi:STAS domain-containing protein [Algoriphagus hitonicola]|uniref:Anti-sigma factor antagonist n=1 Tax=Algoriphagus hitonicola TaxID=435880 RepID=A0A1I2VYE0_9BACT|nr:STAS domain-containing protein [Algoriphagus hitonicola]SFG94103.1 anti-sigma B factor antagonist [Algoriphagus hitonicola]